MPSERNRTLWGKEAHGSAGEVTSPQWGDVTAPQLEVDVTYPALAQTSTVLGQAQTKHPG
jgi:hypothetical protein